ncbi:Hypothetical predicted protein [Paramuricea clavata]|uniref:Uncharacterized protein n=1 Tax=Paramuricea clavata TaxID=317549 RepID=A0A6S7HN57_PARCT|nr:Hypothetical predicted protein [Paramuricea clavata]
MAKYLQKYTLYRENDEQIAMISASFTTQSASGYLCCCILSSDDDIDNEDFVSHDNGSDDTGDESVPQTNPNENIKFRWTKKDIPISNERFSPKVDDMEETMQAAS